MDGSKYKILSPSEKFEAEEIEILFYEYLRGFAQKHDLSKFEGSSEAHRDNNMYKYIKIDFENNVLKAKYNKRMGVDRVQIDGEQYVVKNRLEEVFFDDIYVGAPDPDDDMEEINFLGVLDSEIVDSSSHQYLRDETSDFILERYKEVMTANQLEKFQRLLDWCNQDGNSVSDLFQRNNPIELSKTEISKILYPDRETKGTMRNIEDMFSSMNSRMDKALLKAGIEKRKVPIRSDYAVKELSFEDNQLLNEYRIKDYVIGRQADNFPDHPMYDRFREEKRDREFIQPEHYEQVLSGEMAVKELINMYKMDKVAVDESRNGKVVTSIGVESNHIESADWAISSEEVENYFKQELQELQNQIHDGYITFKYDAATNMMISNSEFLYPMTVEDVEKLKAISPSRNLSILQNYYSKTKPNGQAKHFKIIDEFTPVIREVKPMITAMELGKIRQDSMKSKGKKH